MKFIVLGGAGAMGRKTVEDLAKSASQAAISKITVADINENASQKLVQDINNSLPGSSSLQLNAKKLDAFQSDYLVEVIREYDVVVSALGPYYIFEERMVRAVLEARVDYISICDEWDVVDKMIRQYHGLAKENGVKIICGMGASPGITNLVAMNLASELDEVRKIDVSVWLPMDSGAGAAAIQHGVHIMAGEMAVWRNASRKLIRPCTESVQKTFPNAGRQTLWNMGHSEPVTLPLYIDKIEELNFYMGFGWASFLLTGPARLGWYNETSVKKAFTNAFISIENILSTKKARKGASRIDVWGRLNGKEEQLTAFGVSTMQDSTALALSVGAQMLAGGELRQQEGGVFAPEGIFEATKCLNRLTEKGIVIYKDLELLHQFDWK